MYIYPNLKTALIGLFNDGVMKAARETRIIGERCNRGIKEIKLARPKTSSPLLKYFRPNQIRIADQPRVMDALDKRNIYIKTAEFGDSVFARRDIPSGEIVAYYSGLLWTPKDLFPINQTIEERYTLFPLYTLLTFSKISILIKFIHRLHISDLQFTKC